MKDRWNQDFFWSLELNTWIKKERILILDVDNNVITGTTIGSSTGTTF